MVAVEGQLADALLTESVGQSNVLFGRSPASDEKRLLSLMECFT